MKIFTSVVIPLWAIAFTLVCSSLMVGHWVSLPTPAVGSTIQRAGDHQELPTSKQPSDKSRLQVSHFLYADCPCSKKVLDYIVHRQPLSGVSERIVLIGTPTEQELNAAFTQFTVEIVDPSQLFMKYGVESAPLMIVTDAQGVILYSGGYTSRKQGIDYQDQQIVQRLSLGERVESLPLYGCAVSNRLKRIVDPIGLKY